MKIGLIIGCARSGTSILGELIAAHPDVKYIYEAHPVWEIGGAGANESHRLTAAHATPEVVREIREWFERESGGKMVVEKCPRNALRVPFIRAIFPDARIIHIVRDGRDTTCSLKPGVGGEEWRHLKPEDWQELRRLPWAERCAKLWAEVVTLAEDELAGVDHLTLRYEDLLAEPRTQADRILEFLELPASEAVTAFCDKVQNKTEGSYMADNYTKKWNTPDHAVRVGRWRENLTAEEQRAVETITASALRRFGYES